ncbi:sugar phosphate isomerase/epimerase family protein [Agromyces mangrovi Wang et al. 2018]|uniref:sugar phosphate isomerase/epimerase family protein n=1 Tax=Agromyces mangrovi TaxID=1858653 RepID=UPI00257317F7|nr:sugar phosphate isomerase/epimerase family protein [Agromyces mangrovi]BDZ64916.1 sugar phosphate isomerase [Agromyces mangrovi]
MIGLGTYAFFWQHSDRVPEPLSLVGAFEATRALGVDLFQVCDYAPLLELTEREIGDAARAASDLGLTIELGTKGIAPDHLARFLRLADAFDARLVRSMVFGADFRPTLAEAKELLARSIRDYEAAGVTLALETYEQLPTAELVGLVERVGSDRLGICLDPPNVVAALELPRDTIDACAALTRNVHAKDSAFARQDGWVGFTYTGTPMGEGLGEYPYLFEQIRPREHGINEIVEHWLPWQGDPETTVRTEREWTATALEYLRSMS